MYIYFINLKLTGMDEGKAGISCPGFFILTTPAPDLRRKLGGYYMTRTGELILIGVSIAVFIALVLS